MRNFIYPETRLGRFLHQSDFYRFLNLREFLPTWQRSWECQDGLAWIVLLFRWVLGFWACALRVFWAGGYVGLGSGLFSVLLMFFLRSCEAKQFCCFLVFLLLWFALCRFAVSGLCLLSFLCLAFVFGWWWCFPGVLCFPCVLFAFFTLFICKINVL